MSAFESKGYSDIFNQRGRDYHKAMVMLPNARDNEFLNVIDQLDLFDGMVIVDMPSGGNYLKSYLPDSVTVVPLETSEIFAQLGRTRVCKWSSLPLNYASVDAVICCAAFHHVEQDDRELFRSEVTRVLRPGGKLVIADVNQGSAVDRYLNGFVDTHNSMGHEGWFLTDSFGKDFSTDALALVSDDYRTFDWKFSDDMAESMTYMKLLFGIDNASLDDLSNYLEEHLGLRRGSDGVYKMDWSLRYFTFTKFA